MSDVAEALGMTSGENVAAMSPAQAAARLAELGAQEEFRNKLFSSDGKTVKLFQDLARKRSETATAESLIAAAADPTQPLPPAGGMLRKGVSKRDEIVGVQDQLALGGSIEEAVEFEIGEAMLPPADFAVVERQVSARCLNNPEFVKRYLSGNPEARLTMDRWHRIAVTSRPWPVAPTTGIAR